ncbi:MAG: hypothetical protein HYW49_01695 [Deltaproteobacteria bacterium]|nr:hypothetical protein [Deltaproteobacteria bacterium]
MKCNIKKIKLVSLLVFATLVSGCDDDKQTVFGGFGDPDQRGFRGAFENELMMPIPNTGNNTTFYVQNGIQYMRKEDLDSNFGFCRFTVKKAKFSSADLVKLLNLQSVGMPLEKNYWNGRGDVVRGLISRHANNCSLQLSFGFEAPIDSKPLIMATFYSEISCAKSTRTELDEIPEMTNGELRQILGFYPHLEIYM